MILYIFAAQAQSGSLTYESIESIQRQLSNIEESLNSQVELINSKVDSFNNAKDKEDFQTLKGEIKEANRYFKTFVSLYLNIHVI